MALLAGVMLAAGLGHARATPAGPAALDCARLDGAEVPPALAMLPAPRIVNLHGSVPIVTMEPFARFLISMGYPEASLRDPRDGSLSTSSHGSSEVLAGVLAWHYEQTGLRPMLIGHSQGGMLVVRTLHELDGAFTGEIAVHDPVRDVTLSRNSIRDPLTLEMRPVVGLRVSFAAAIATGMLPRLLLGQWSMLARLRQVPDTVDEFTGFTIAWDPIAGNLGEAAVYTARGRAKVRNVLLPATTTHIGAPLTEHLAVDPVTREAIMQWRPELGLPRLTAEVADARNLQHAADLWFSVRRHWCVEGVRRQRAQGLG